MLNLTLTDPNDTNFIANKKLNNGKLCANVMYASTMYCILTVNNRSTETTFYSILYG